MTKGFTLDEKRVYAELMGYIIGWDDLPPTRRTNKNWVYKQSLRSGRLELPPLNLEAFNPLDHFDEILKGLSDDEWVKVCLYINNNYQCPFYKKTTKDKYLWTASHKTEILQAIYEVVKEK